MASLKTRESWYKLRQSSEAACTMGANSICRAITRVSTTSQTRRALVFRSRISCRDQSGYDTVSGQRRPIIIICPARRDALVIDRRRPFSLLLILLFLLPVHQYYYHYFSLPTTTSSHYRSISLSPRHPATLSLSEKKIYIYMDEDGNTRDRYIARDNSATVNRYKFPSVHQTFRVLTFDHFRIKNEKGRGKKRPQKKKKNNNRTGKKYSFRRSRRSRLHDRGQLRSLGYCALQILSINSRNISVHLLIDRLSLFLSLFLLLSLSFQLPSPTLPP